MQLRILHADETSSDDRLTIKIRFRPIDEMSSSTRGLLKAAGVAAGLVGAAAGVIMISKRVRCPCDGTSLPFLGDKEPLGKRYCKTCQHHH
jgi:hypothetical protein